MLDAYYQTRSQFVWSKRGVSFDWLGDGRWERLAVGMTIKEDDVSTFDGNTTADRFLVGVQAPRGNA